jgi:TM2 domain-containing membrane protein YozV
MAQADISTRSRLITLLLCFFLGYFGVHRFYVGKVGTGLLMILTVGGAGIWWLIDIIIIACGSFRDKEEKRILSWFEPGHEVRA